MPISRAQQIEVLLGARCSRRRAAPRLRRAVRIEVVHAVEHAQQGRLAAARRTDERRHLVFVERHVDVFERPGFAVVEVEIAHRDLLARSRSVGAPWLTGVVILARS